MFLGACGAPASKTEARGMPPVNLVASANDEVTVGVLELICQSCAEHIVAGCRQIEGGVASVETDRRARLITLRFDPLVTTRARILAAVDDVVASIP
jgi:copper chaperone CopZ